MDEILVLKYQEVLKNINKQENHVLIANGFNYGLGINTGYKAIFTKMVEKHYSVYKDALGIVEDCDYDLEKFIGMIESDINDKNVFLRKYIKNKIKLDFMQATHEIVKSELKNIYAEKNEGIYLLLKQFDNYFTLNYDSFLYLLLLKYKPIENESKNVVVFEPNLNFIIEDQNQRHNDIYHEIKIARENGKLRISFGGGSEIIEKDLSNLTKTHFIAEVKEYSKTNGKGWKTKEIEKVVNRILEEENRLFLLNKIDDGIMQLDLFDENAAFIYENRDTQNLFFLHGAFHIYKDGDSIRKITQQSDKALYDKLEEVLNGDEKEVVCVFQNENKIEAIKRNNYLDHCLKKLGQIAGNLVIIGSSLSDNDNHIFDRISNSKVHTVYISVLPDNKEIMLGKAKSKLPTKNLFLFDANSISYELPSGNE